MTKNKRPRNSFHSQNLSHVWADIFLEMYLRNHEISPFVISLEKLSENKPLEVDGLREKIEDCYEVMNLKVGKEKYQPIETVANTIFPLSLWRTAKGDRKKFFAEYIEYLPDYVAMNVHKNKCGLYFARLVAFDIDAKTGKKIPHVKERKGCDPSNQLEFIIQNCKKGQRRTKFQAAIFDPFRDQSQSAQQGFPCMQHVTFIPDFDRKTLVLNAFYATQQTFVKAYGNWLGLVRLGEFVASQTGLKLDQLTCFAGIQKMDYRPKQCPELVAIKEFAKAICQPPVAELATAG